jgi:hypothetical protein
MKNKVYIFLIALVIYNAGVLTAQTSQGIPSGILNSKVKTHLELIFNQYLTRDDLKISEISCTTDWDKSSKNKDTSYFDVEAKFVNFPFEKRTLYGRLTTKIAVKKIEGKKTVDWVVQEQKENIVLLVDDLLSNADRDALVLKYIDQNYNHPLDSDIKKDRTENYPDKIYSYVTLNLNYTTIKYLRVVFEHKLVEDTPYSGINLKQTKWELKGADELFSCEFPVNKQIISDCNKPLFPIIRDKYNSAVGEETIFEFTSAIDAISNIELYEAANQIIKLTVDFQYNLGKLFGWKKYKCKAFVIYEYNIEKNKLMFKQIEIIDANVR